MTILNDSEYGNFDISDNMEMPREDNAIHLAGCLMTGMAIKNKKPLYESTISGSYAGTFQNYVDAVSGLCEEAHLTKARVDFSWNKMSDDSILFLSRLTMVSIERAYSSSTTVYLRIMTFNKSVYDFFLEWAKKNIVIKPQVGTIHTIVSKRTGMSIEALGAGGEDFVPENYSAEVQKDFKTIVADLEAVKPSGRLSILSGPPGTGKTFFVKGLLRATNKVNFVLLEPNKVSALTSPEGIPLILNFRNVSSSSYAEDDDLVEALEAGGVHVVGDEAKKKPTVFVIEDADAVLAPRQAENMSDIHSLLNLCDGIIGSLLDIRVIATTNAEKPQLDEALQRPGRLTVCSEIGKLSYEEASVVYKRLNGAGELEVKPYTLAEVYSAASGSVVKGKTKRKLGFGS